MPRDYDRDYTSEDNSDYKRKRRNDEENIKSEEVDGDEAQQTAIQHDAPPLNEKTAAYLEECVQEKNSLDSNKYNVCKRLLDDGKLGFEMICFLLANAHFVEYSSVQEYLHTYVSSYMNVFCFFCVKQKSNAS